MKRRPDSVRFDPYWKIQWRDPRSLAWIDVQETFDSPLAAQGAISERGKLGERWRLMEVFPGGRRPGGEVEL